MRGRACENDGRPRAQRVGQRGRNLVAGPGGVKQSQPLARPVMGGTAQRLPPLSDALRYPHPSCFSAKPECQIFVMWTILSPLNCMTYT